MFTCSFCEKAKEVGIQSQVDRDIIICNDCIRLAMEKLVACRDWKDSEEAQDEYWRK